MHNAVLTNEIFNEGAHATSFMRIFLAVTEVKRFRRSKLTANDLFYSEGAFIFELAHTGGLCLNQTFPDGSQGCQGNLMRV